MGLNALQNWLEALRLQQLLRFLALFVLIVCTIQEVILENEGRVDRHKKGRNEDTAIIETAHVT